MGWQIYAAGAAVAVILGLTGLLLRRRDSRKRGAEREARETLERMVEMDEKGHELDGRPVPLSLDEQQRRLRALQARIARHRS
jgi:hypothetical protein